MSNSDKVTYDQVEQYMIDFYKRNPSFPFPKDPKGRCLNQHWRLNNPTENPIIVREVGGYICHLSPEVTDRKVV